MKWSELIKKVSEAAESVFEVPGFKKGKLTVEVEGDINFVITFEKDASGKLNGSFGFQISSSASKEETGTKEAPETEKSEAEKKEEVGAPEFII